VFEYNSFCTFETFPFTSAEMYGMFRIQLNGNNTLQKNGWGVGGKSRHRCSFLVISEMSITEHRIHKNCTGVFSGKLAMYFSYSMLCHLKPSFILCSLF
jgi:hypothetical protein